jgi:hypothetical protein
MKNHRKILQAAALAAALLAAGWLPADDSAEAQPGSSALSLDQRVRIIERLLENQAADTAFTSKAGLVTKPTAATAETSSVRAAHEWAVGINWYPVRDVKVTLAYDTTRFEHGIATVADRETEQLLDSRVQFTF